MSSDASASASADKAKKITLKAANGDEFEVAAAVAMEFRTVRTYFEDPSAVTTDSVVPLPNLKSTTLAKIVEFGTKQVALREQRASAEAVKSYNAGFVESLSGDAVKELLLAANYLNYKELMDLLNQSLADLISNNSVEYLRNYFGVVSDFTEEEEEALRNENPWAFEGVDED